MPSIDLSHLYSRFLDIVRYAIYRSAEKGSTLARIFHRAMPSPNLTRLDDVTILSPAVIRILGQNPGPFTLQGTNTYLLGTGSERILIDAGESNILAYLEKLAQVIKWKPHENGVNSVEPESIFLSAIILTHWHHDHSGGIPGILQKFCGGRKVPVYKLYRPEGEHYSFDVEYVRDGHQLSVEGVTLRIIQTPGHTTDHASVYFVEENAIFSGDCILGEGTSVFEDLHTYMASLRQLLEFNPTKIYPGHGPVVENAVEKINEYISHREMREQQILEVIRLNGSTGETPITIATKIYPDVPISVRIAALGSVNHHLAKLLKDGQVKQDGSTYYLCDGR